MCPKEIIRQWCIEWDEGMSDRKVSTEWIYGTAVSALESSGAKWSLDGYHLWTSVFSLILIQTKLTSQSCCRIKCDNGHASNLQVLRHWTDIWGHSHYHSAKPKSIILLSETSNIYFIGSSSQNDTDVVHKPISFQSVFQLHIHFLFLFTYHRQKHQGILKNSDLGMP